MGLLMHPRILLINAIFLSFFGFPFFPFTCSPLNALFGCYCQLELELNLYTMYNLTTPEQTSYYVIPSPFSITA